MSKDTIQTDLKNRVAKGLNFGIEALEEVLDPTSAIYNDFVLLQSKYNDLMYISSMNTLPYEQIEVGMDRLRSTLLAIVGRLDEASLQKEEVNTDLKMQALPARRANFFQLLDIHFKNLEAIQYIEVFDKHETRERGRQAIFLFYNMHRRSFRSREEVKGTEGRAILKAHFYDYFFNETGRFEVYLKNIKHLLSYTLSSEVERQFFLDTVSSLFSKFELATIFYYVLSEIDPEFNELVKASKLIDKSVDNILIVKEHGKIYRAGY